MHKSFGTKEKAEYTDGKISKKGLQSVFLYVILTLIKSKEDESMNAFCMNSLRRRERRRKLL